MNSQPHGRIPDPAAISGWKNLKALVGTAAVAVGVLLILRRYRVNRAMVVLSSAVIGILVLA